MIDGVVGRRISQDPGHAIGWHCNVPERLGGRPSSQILDSGRLQPHDESRVTPLENPSFLPSPLGKRTSESVPAVIGTALPSPPPPPPRRWRKLDAAAKSERRCFTSRCVGTRIVGCHLVTNRLSRTEYGTDCVSGRALF